MKKWRRNGLVSVVWVDLLGLVGGGKRRKAWSMVLRVRFGVELRGVRCLRRVGWRRKAMDSVDMRSARYSSQEKNTFRLDEMYPQNI